MLDPLSRKQTEDSSAPAEASQAGKRPWRDILIMLAVTVVLLLASELVARGFLWEPASGTSYGLVDYGFNPGGYGDLMPNQDGIWTIWPHRPFHVQTNSVGLRNAEEVDDSRFRILAVGDSLTFGPYVDNEDTWPGWLESILNARLQPGSRIQVLNAGITGYTIEDVLAYLREKGLALQPDLVILGVFSNDVSDLRPEARQLLQRRREGDSGGAQAQPLGQLRSFLAEHSALYHVAGNLRHRLLGQNAGSGGTEGDDWVEGGAWTARAEADRERRRVEHRSIAYEAPDDPQHTPYYEQYETLLREAITLVAAENVPLVVVAFPEFIQLPANGYPDTPQRFFAGIAQDTTTPFLDLLPPLREVGSPELVSLVTFNPEAPLEEGASYFPERTQYEGDGHYSRYGNYVAASSIADWLLGLELVPVP